MLAGGEAQFLLDQTVGYEDDEKPFNDSFFWLVLFYMVFKSSNDKLRIFT